MNEIMSIFKCYIVSTLRKEKGFNKLAQRAYVHLLKSKDKDIEYLKEHFIDLENEYNKVK